MQDDSRIGAAGRRVQRAAVEQAVRVPDRAGQFSARQLRCCRVAAHRANFIRRRRVARRARARTAARCAQLRERRRGEEHFRPGARPAAERACRAVYAPRGVRCRAEAIPEDAVVAAVDGEERASATGRRCGGRAAGAREALQRAPRVAPVRRVCHRPRPPVCRRPTDLHPHHRRVALVQWHLALVGRAAELGREARARVHADLQVPIITVVPSRRRDQAEAVRAGAREASVDRDGSCSGAT